MDDLRGLRKEALGSWKEAKNKANDRAELSSFEKDGSPSGLSIERLQTANTKNIVQEFLASPANVLRKIDETVKANGRTWTPEELLEVSKWRAVFNQLAKASPNQPVTNAQSLTKMMGTFAMTNIGQSIIKSWSDPTTQQGVPK
jgi:hypothetical protein